MVVSFIGYKMVEIPVKGPYCVSNIPSAIAHSASIAYAAAINRHIGSLLNKGVKQACIEDGYLRRGMVTYKGYLTHEETSQIQERPWIQPEKIMNIENEKLEDVYKRQSSHRARAGRDISLSPGRTFALLRR